MSLLDALLGLITKLENGIVFFFLSLSKYMGGFVILTVTVTENLGWISARDHVT